MILIDVDVDCLWFCVSEIIEPTHSLKYFALHGILFIAVSKDIFSVVGSMVYNSVIRNIRYINVTLFHRNVYTRIPTKCLQPRKCANEIFWTNIIGNKFLYKGREATQVRLECADGNSQTNRVLPN